VTGPATLTAPRAARPAPRRSVPQAVQGRYRRIKTLLTGGLLALFFVTPWLRFDRGESLPGQAVLFDVAGRRMFAFGLEFWPQDLPLAVGVLVLAACGLFYATTLAGRVWCGFACPQTVWSDLYFAVERWTERLTGRDSPLGRAVRSILWIAIAVVTGFGFTAYFVDVTTLPWRLVSGTAPLGAYVTVGLLTLTTWLLAAYARERVCLHMCPWPRFQAALLDRHSLVVTYQAWRGEPRGRKRVPLRPDLAHPTLEQLVSSATAEVIRGDCIDCTRCVTVCPTGVDIRHGLQMGCIGCGLCIDACDDVMTRIDRPAGLIRFDTESAEARRSFTPARITWLRPKAMLFATACLLALGGIGYGMSHLASVTIDMDPQRNPPFVRLTDGSVRNDYVFRLAHRRGHLPAVTLSVEGLPAATLRAGSHEGAGAATLTLPVDGDRTAGDRLLITVPKGSVPSGRTPVTFVFTDPATGERIGAVDSYFWGAGA